MRLAQRLLVGALAVISVLVIFLVAIASNRLRGRLYDQTAAELETAIGGLIGPDPSFVHLSLLGSKRSRMRGGAYGAYCASPLPNDQFSFFTSIRLMNTSCGRRFKC